MDKCPSCESKDVKQAAPQKFLDCTWYVFQCVACGYTWTHDVRVAVKKS